MSVDAQVGGLSFGCAYLLCVIMRTLSRVPLHCVIPVRPRSFAAPPPWVCAQSTPPHSIPAMRF